MIFGSKIDSLKREYDLLIERKDQEIENLRAEIVFLRNKLNESNKKLQELKQLEREREIEHIMRSMTYDELCELVAKEDVHDTYKEAAQRVSAQRSELAAVIERSIVRVQLKSPRKTRQRLF